MEFRSTLFWDVNPANIDPQKDATYIIERILDLGNDSEVRWMWYYYDHDLIRNVVLTSRILQAQTRALWNLLTT